MPKQFTGLKQIYSSDILTVGSVQLEKLGTHGWDESGFEYVYLSGTASIVADDWCVYDENFATTRLVADEVGPVAVAATAIILNQYGWFLIKGVVLGNSDAIGADSSLYIDGTAGRVDDLGVSGDLVIGAYSMTAAVNNKATCYITYPHVSNDLGGSAGGAPTGAQYITLATHADLTAERVLTGTPNQIIITDGGANGNITLATPQNISATATVEFGSATIHTLASGTASITGGTITGITDLTLADGGTGTSYVDPNADRIMFWDDSAGVMKWLEPLNNLAITDTSISVGTANALNVTAGVSGTAIMTPVSLSGSDYGKRLIQVLMTDPNAAASGANTGTSYIRIDSNLNNYRLVDFQGGIATGSASAGGGISITARNMTKGYDIVSTPLWIDSNESDSLTAATAVVITSASATVATGDKIRLVIGGQGTATGIITNLIYQL